MGEIQRLQAVHQLGHVGHGDLVRMPLKDVERQPCEERVAHRRLLAEEVRGWDRRSRAVPGSPLIDNQPDPMLAIDLPP